MILKVPTFIFLVYLVSFVIGESILEPLQARFDLSPRSGYSIPNCGKVPGPCLPLTLLNSYNVFWNVTGSLPGTFSSNFWNFALARREISEIMAQNDFSGMGNGSTMPDFKDFTVGGVLEEMGAAHNAPNRLAFAIFECIDGKNRDFVAKFFVCFLGVFTNIWPGTCRGNLPCGWNASCSTTRNDNKVGSKLGIQGRLFTVYWLEQPSEGAKHARWEEPL